ncbi:MAG: hypothetical protein E6K92_00280 [Thaumarchaeota archaeon]|nr:MAG: hypothetical protein E6K92_00280 [Nitrososphaerota archaeon]
MGFAPLVALVGLVFGMIAIKLMSIVENAQIVVVKGVRKSNRLRRESLKGIKSKKIVTFAISTHQLLFLRISISFFVRISSIIFIAEAMFPEKIVEGAAFAMMKTVVISNRIRVATVRNGRHTIQKIRMKNNNVNDNDAYEK